MDRFSKMNLLGSTKQRSMELLDLLSLPQNPKPIEINTTTTTTTSGPNAAQSHKTKQTTILEHSHSPSSRLELEDDYSDSYSDGEQQSGVRFLLHRSRSVSSEAALPHRFWFYKAQGKVKIQAAAAVKRHCRTINGHCLTTYSPFGDDDTGDAAQSMVNNNNIALQTKMKKKKISKLQQRTGKIFKACKGIFGF